MRTDSETRPGPNWRGLWPEIGVVCGLALAFSIRVNNLGFQSFWGDEEFTVRFSSLPLFDILREIAKQGEPHPPLYYYLMHFWLMVSGKDDFAVRFSSVLPGLISVALIYVLGTRLFNRYVGLLAALILAINPFFVYHGQEARMYPLATMLGLASTYAFVLLSGARRTEDSQNTKRFLWAVYVLVSVCSIFVHYYTAFIVLFQNIYVGLLLVRRPEGLFKWVLTRWVPAQLAIIGLLAPWLIWAWQIINAYGGQGSTADFLSGPASLFPVFSLGWSLDPQLRSELWLGYLAIFLIGVIMSLRSHRESALIVLLYLIVPVMAVIAVSLQRPIFSQRYLMSTLPAFVLLLAYGIHTLMRTARWSVPGILLPVLGTTALVYVFATAAIPLQARHSDSSFMNADFRGMAGFVADFVQPDDALIFEVGHGDVLFGYYYQGRQFSTYYQFPDLVKGFPVGTEKVLEDIATKHRRLWLVLYAAKQVDPGDVVERWLDDNAFKAYNSYFGVGRLVLYETAQGFVERQADISFGNGVSLEGIGLDGQAKAGDVLRVKLAWRVGRPLVNDYRVVLRMYDSKGHLVTQVDRLPKDGYIPLRAWQTNQQVNDDYGLFLPPGLLPGKYRVELGLYEPATGWQGTVTPLGEVVVERSPNVYPISAFGSKRSANASLGEGLILVDSHIPGATLKPGDDLPVEILWGLTGSALKDNALKLRLTDATGKIVAEQTSSMSSEQYPTSSWRDGEIIRDYVDLPLGPGIASGTYRILVSAGFNEVSLGEVKVQGRDRTFDQPSFQNNSSIFFGDSIQLSGWEMSGVDLRPGDKLDLSLCWKATGSIDENYSVFVHLLDSKGRVAAQHDGSPANGTAKTAGWLNGEFVTDRHSISLGREMPPGRYAIEIGLYRPDSGVRLITKEGGDHLILSEVVVR